MNIEYNAIFAYFYILNKHNSEITTERIIKIIKIILDECKHFEKLSRYSNLISFGDYPCNNNIFKDLTKGHSFVE